MPAPIKVPSTGQVIVKQDAHRPVPLGQDHRSEIMGGLIPAYIAITPEFGSLGQVRMHLLGILDYLEVVIIGARKGTGIRDRDGDILPEVVGVRSP
jgi:hypothetical protein